MRHRLAACSLSCWLRQLNGSTATGKESVCDSWTAVVAVPPSAVQTPRRTKLTIAVVSPTAIALVFLPLGRALGVGVADAADSSVLANLSSASTGRRRSARRSPSRTGCHSP